MLKVVHHEIHLRVNSRSIRHCIDSSALQLSLPLRPQFGMPCEQPAVPSDKLVGLGADVPFDLAVLLPGVPSRDSGAVLWLAGEPIKAGALELAAVHQDAHLL